MEKTSAGATILGSIVGGGTVIGVGGAALQHVLSAVGVDLTYWTSVAAFWLAYLLSGRLR